MELFDGPEERVRVSEDLVRRVASLPGVANAGLGTNVPFGGDDGFRNVRDLDGPGPTREFSAGIRAVSANYFDLWQMPVTRGRAQNARAKARPRR